jgi:hypothetical protein
MREWINKHAAGGSNVVHRLSKDSVRNHQNIRKAGDASAPTVNTHTHGMGAGIIHGHGQGQGQGHTQQAASKISHTFQ